MLNDSENKKGAVPDNDKEIVYFIERYGITKQQVLDIIAIVGPEKDKIEEYLEKNSTPDSLQ